MSYDDTTSNIIPTTPTNTNTNNNNNDNNKKKELEKGCVTPLQGIKSKCVIRIVPKTKKVKTFYMDPKCKTKRLLDGKSK